MPVPLHLPKILLAEHEPFLAGMYKARLALEGFDVIAAADGEAALAYFEDSPFNLVLLDMLIPKVNAFEVLKRIRRHKSKAKLGTPVIMLAGISNQADIEGGLIHGANGSIDTALCTPAEVADKIKKYIK